METILIMLFGIFAVGAAALMVGFARVTRWNSFKSKEDSEWFTNLDEEHRDQY
jgi:hypothetical protein